MCILEYLLSRRRDICEVAREVILDVATDITDVQREHCGKKGIKVWSGKKDIIPQLDMIFLAPEEWKIWSGAY